MTRAANSGMRSMHRGAAISALLLTAITGLRARSAGAQGEPEKIQIAAATAEDLTALYYGIKTGMFSRSGLDISMVATSSGAAATTAVINGTCELARSSLLAILSAYVRGIPVTIVAPSIVSTAKNANVLLQVAPDASLRSGADFSGKTIGVASLGDINSLSVRAWVDRTGGDWKSVKFVEIPNGALEAALSQHRVDAAEIQSPALDASIARGTSKTLAYSHAAIAPAFMSAAYVARTDWAAGHAEQIRRFSRALGEANTYVMAHPAETKPLVVELTKISVAPNEKMHRTLNATSLDPALIQPVIDAAAKYGLISRSFPAREILWSP